MTFTFSYSKILLLSLLYRSRRIKIDIKEQKNLIKKFEKDFALIL